jgi:hypothetical protein
LPCKPIAHPLRQIRFSSFGGLAGRLIFGARIARGDGQAPIYTVSLMTFLIVLGLGLSPSPQDSGDIFVSRVFDVMVAGAYASMASLLRSAFRAL